MTVASFIPASFTIKICDENVEDIDFDTDAQYIFITAKMLQYERVKEIATIFRALNKVIVIGGPLASLNPDLVKDFTNVVVIGEIESIVDELFDDLLNGTFKKEYVGTRSDKIISKLPMFELYISGYALAGTMQTSRGCSFKCDFCDVVEYAGNVQRFKDIEDVMMELRILYTFGYRYVFIADDNFALNEKRTIELLLRMKEFNSRQDYDKMFFVTQLSAHTANNKELVRLMGEAGIINVFIGIETLNMNSLVEISKQQNINIDYKNSISTFLDNGICVICGFIAGFDSDTIEVFDDIFDFMMDTPVGLCTVYSLMAPSNTALYKRLKLENRVDSELLSYVPWESNITPLQMTKQQLNRNVYLLLNDLYSAENFEKRVVRFIEQVKPNENLKYVKKNPSTSIIFSKIIKHLIKDKREKTMIDNMFKMLKKKRDASQYIYQMLFHYAQIKYMLTK